VTLSFSSLRDEIYVAKIDHLKLISEFREEYQSHRISISEMELIFFESQVVRFCTYLKELALFKKYLKRKNYLNEKKQ
jgi:hypothetical protein